MKAKPGQQASIRELALELGVSTATVSRALNNHPSVSPDTRARVLELADQAGYMPRVGQRFRNVVGLAYPSNPVMPEFGSFESAMLGGVMKGLDADRYDLALIDIHRDKHRDESYTQFFRRKGVRGVIIRPVSPEPTIAETIAEEGFPCVMVADRSDHPNLGFVCSDSGRDSYRAVDHLIHLGHKRIALVCHAVLDSDHRDRIEGYRRALQDHGIETSPETELFLPASMEGGAEAIDRLLSLEDPPTALFITNPVPTVGALHRCLELGIRVPDDLSIMGFDDSNARSRTYPRYSAVCQNAEQFGYDAARWLTRRLEGTETGVLRVHRPTTLQFNRSTGPVPAKAIRLASNKSDIVRVEFPKRPRK
ncbi:MAG: LacI family transcriptional regulator [Phycisphaera sp.]|nr:MAG: LacI family transcriptional regulator [Phycisphaera sp.]